MIIQLDEGVSKSCISACAEFLHSIEGLKRSDLLDMQSLGAGTFSTARQIGTVYSLFAGEDLQSLLNGFIAQAEAMSVMFAVGGGLLEAQDEAVAAALSKAAAEPAGLVSLGLMSDEVVVTETACTAGYGRVGPEDVSGASLEWMASGAEALTPGEYARVAARVRGVAEGLGSAAGALRSDLGDVLGGAWQGEFASQAQVSVQGLARSAEELSQSLTLAADKADRVHDGFATTKSNVGAQAASFARSRDQVGPFAAPEAEQIAADMWAAEEQARAVINTEYSPSVMDANLDDLDFPTAYRVVSGAAIGGPDGVDVANVWNTEGVVRPAAPGEPDAAAIAAATGSAAGATGGGAGATGGGAGASTAGAPVTGGMPTDAATEQALLAGRAGDGLGGAAGVGATGAGAIGGLGPAGTAGSGAGAGAAGGGPVNAGTAAAASAAPLMNAQGAGTGAGSGAGRGGRGEGRGRSGDRSFGSAAGLLGGGGAAAAGAGVASRMGGAGTLSGLGSGAGVGAGGSGPWGGTPSGSAGAVPTTTAAGTSTGGAGASRMGAAPMGMMGAGAGANRDGRAEGHRPAGYLVNATNTSEILGEPVKVAPPVIGRHPDAPSTPTPGPKPEELSPAQALVNRLKGR